MLEYAHRRPRHRSRARTQRIAIPALGLAGLGLLGLSTFNRPAPLIIYNASASAPIGFYRVIPAHRIRHGDLVLVRTPESVRTLAATRRYLPLDASLVKRAEALAGDTVCALNHDITIDGRHVADQLIADRRGRPLPNWTGCVILRRGQIFLLIEGVPDSFDGRYFGPISTSAVIGRLVPLWLR